MTSIVTTEDVEQANTSNKWRTAAVEEKGSKHRAAAKGEQQDQQQVEQLQIACEQQQKAYEQETKKAYEQLQIAGEQQQQEQQQLNYDQHELAFITIGRFMVPRYSVQQAQNSSKGRAAAIEENVKISPFYDNE